MSKVTFTSRLVPLTIISRYPLPGCGPMLAQSVHVVRGLAKGHFENVWAPLCLQPQRNFGGTQDDSLVTFKKTMWKKFITEKKNDEEQLQADQYE